MTHRRVALGMAVVGLIACARSSTDTPRTGDPATSRATVAAIHGPRVFDWTSVPLPQRQKHDLPDDVLRAALGPSNAVDWNVPTGAPVTAAAATYAASWTESSGNASDLLFFAVNGSGSGVGIQSGTTGASAANANVFALNNLYGASPNVVWAVSVGSGVDRSSVTISLDGSQVYFVDTSGTLHCITGAAGATCTGWTDYASGNPVHGSSPWIDYQTGYIFFGDDAGILHQVASNGTSLCAVSPATSSTYTASFESSPVELNGQIYIGDDMGQVYRIKSAPNGHGTGGCWQPNSSDVAVFATCSATGSSAPCVGWGGSSSSPSTWAVRAPLGFDVKNGHAYVVANNYAFELTSTGSWTTSATPKNLNTGVSGPMYAAPVVDQSYGFLYTAFNNTLFKITRPFTGSSTSGFSSNAMANSGTGTNYSFPLPYTVSGTDYIFVGDTAGYTERFDCTSQAGKNMVDGQTSNYGSSINTPMILDFSTGNVNFGYTNGSGGGLVQYPLTGSGTWGCPSAASHLCTQTGAEADPTETCSGTSPVTYGDACHQCCNNTDCSGTPSTPKCTNGICAAGCTTASNCPTLGHTTVACTSNTCVYACVTGWTNCDGTESVNGCNVNTKTDSNNCGGCGLACSNKNIPNPLCLNSTCQGHCADGWVHCSSNGTRQAVGCETAAGCGIGGCCGNTTACSTSQVCYDYNSNANGACVTGQTVQAAAETSQNGSLTVTCPSTQQITGITFADYGTPGGQAGYSFTGSVNSCYAKPNTGSTGCNSYTGCRVTYGTNNCNEFSCSSQTTRAACNASSGCVWAGTTPGSETGTCTSASCYGLSQAQCTPTNCGSFTNLSTCQGSNAPTSSCTGFTTQATCAGNCNGGSAANCPPTSTTCSGETAQANCPSTTTTCAAFTDPAQCPSSSCSALSSGFSSSNCSASATTCAKYTNPADCPQTATQCQQFDVKGCSTAQATCSTFTTSSNCPGSASACSPLSTSACSATTGTCSAKAQSASCVETASTCNSYDTTQCKAQTCSRVTTAALCGTNPACAALTTSATCQPTNNTNGCVWNNSTAKCEDDGCVWNTTTNKCEADGCAVDTNQNLCEPEGCFWTGTACQPAACIKGAGGSCVPTGCLWSGSACLSANCVANGTLGCEPQGCAWSTTQNACIPAGCAQGTGGNCENAGCSWNGSSCEPLSCAWNSTCQPVDVGCTWNSSSSQCQSVNNCVWDNTNNKCEGPTGCLWDPTDSVCVANTCAWDSALNLCTSNTGFLHDYGTLSCNGSSCTGACAMDVSASTSFNSCIGQTSCTVTAPPSGGFLPSNGQTYATAGTTQLPLTLGGSYYTDPCAGIAPSLAVQVSCSMCK